MNIQTSTDLQEAIRERVDCEPIGQVAKDLGIAEVYLLQIISGQRKVSKKVALRMGYKLVDTPRPERIFEAV